MEKNKLVEIPTGRFIPVELQLVIEDMDELEKFIELFTGWDADVIDLLTKHRKKMLNVGVQKERY